MKDVFYFILGVWFLAGIAGITELVNRRYEVNWEMIIFLATIPFLPFLAHFCGM